ncbi:MAG: hypothetical protein ACYSX1_13180, partial [Planctomycetota bacterium]
MKRIVISVVLLLACRSFAAAVDIEGKSFTNSIGMKFVRIEPGSFEMGQLKTPLPSEVLPSLESGYGGGLFDLLADGDFDERPVH